MDANKRLKVAIVGCGNIAGGYDERGPTDAVMTHAKAFQQNSHTLLASAYDPDEKRLRAFCEAWRVPQAFRSLPEMLATVRPDIVSVCAPNEFHVSIVREVVRHQPAAILCEKPLALSLGDAEEMLRLCRENSILLVVNYMRRWDPALAVMGQRIAAGEFGRIQNGRVYYTKGVFHNASHGINLLSAWLGGGRCESAWGARPWGENDVSASFRLAFDRCPEVVFQYCDAERFNFFEIELVAEKARILLAGGGNTIAITPAVPSSLVPGTSTLSATPTLQPGSLSRALSYVVEDLVRALQMGTPPQMPAEDALATMRICAQVRDSV